MSTKPGSKDAKPGAKRGSDKEASDKRTGIILLALDGLIIFSAVLLFATAPTCSDELMSDVAYREDFNISEYGKIEIQSYGHETPLFNQFQPSSYGSSSYSSSYGSGSKSTSSSIWSFWSSLFGGGGTSSSSSSGSGSTSGSNYGSTSGTGSSSYGSGSSSYGSGSGSSSYGSGSTSYGSGSSSYGSGSGSSTYGSGSGSSTYGSGSGSPTYGSGYGSSTYGSGSSSSTYGSGYGSSTYGSGSGSSTYGPGSGSSTYGSGSSSSTYGSGSGSSTYGSGYGSSTFGSGSSTYGSGYGSSTYGSGSGSSTYGSGSGSSPYGSGYGSSTYGSGSGSSTYGSGSSPYGSTYGTGSSGSGTSTGFGSYGSVSGSSSGAGSTYGTGSSGYGSTSGSGFGSYGSISGSGSSSGVGYGSGSTSSGTSPTSGIGASIWGSIPATGGGAGVSVGGIKEPATSGSSSPYPYKDLVQLIPQDRITNTNFKCGVGIVKPNLRPARVVGGSYAVKHSWPWTASLASARFNLKGKGEYTYTPICGGTIVSPRHIISALHCFKTVRGKVPLTLKTTYKKDRTMFIGKHDDKVTIGDKYAIAFVRAHPEGKLDGTPEYDLVLITLEREMTFNDRVQPACLPKFEADLAPKTLCWSYGWGVTKGKGPARGTLKQVQMDVGSIEKCRKDHPLAASKIAKGMTVCVGTRKGHDTCQGDSGGPLTCQEKGKAVLYGATSWGMGCGLGLLAIYADVAYSLEWFCCYMAEIPACEGVSCNPRGRNK